MMPLTPILILCYALAVVRVSCFVPRTLVCHHYSLSPRFEFNMNKIPATETAAPFLKKKRRSGFQKFADKLFEKADVNKDGSLDLNETYEMVLKLYVKLNRKAPIPPPSRAKVRQIFRSTDINGDDRITRQEFNQMASIFGRRALTRLVAHRVVTLTGAPLLATWVVEELRGRVWLKTFAKAVLPDRWLPMVCTVSFWRTFLVVVFVASLGNVVLGSVNFFLDAGSRGDDREENE